MRSLFPRLLATLLLIAGPAHAIPDSFFGGNFIGPIIPATPRFNADLTKEFLSADVWDQGAFSGPWEDAPSLDGADVQRMTAMPIVLGAVPQSIYRHAEDGEVQQLAINFLDAGAWFGYQAGGESTDEQKATGDARRDEFDDHFRQLSRDLEDRLEDGCGRGDEIKIGLTRLLQAEFVDYRWEDFVLRLAVRDDHSISLYLMREEDVVNSFVDPAVASLSDRDREEILKENVVWNERGDLLVSNIPMYTQGNTPFCGIHSLAMTTHYYGLRMPVEGLAGSADFRNTGSARGSDIFDVYLAAGEEMGMRVRVAPRFDPGRVERAIEDGFPVIVWRRVTAEREKAHSEWASVLKDDPDAALPEPTEEDRARWPNRGIKGSPSHASVISGINLERGEVILTEPWGEHARDRRMLIEEMEASAYVAFYFTL